MLMLAILYYWAPNVRPPKFRWITPGSVLAVIVWITASAGFAVYVANFGSYDKTYGSLGAVVIALIWLWISNIAVLLGQELNAELERERELEAGDRRAHREIQVEPRSAPAD
jgi:membrane protein